MECDCDCELGTGSVLQLCQLAGTTSLMLQAGRGFDDLSGAIHRGCFVDVEGGRLQSCGYKTRSVELAVDVDVAIKNPRTRQSLT